MKLFIIGNGFDIAHGLPTRYWDFRTYLSNVQPDFLQSFEEHYDIYPRMSDDAKKKTLWSCFENNLANIDEESIIDDGTSIEMNLESGDVGIEDTLYHHFAHEYQYREYLRSEQIRHPMLDICFLPRPLNKLNIILLNGMNLKTIAYKRMLLTDYS